MAKPNKRFISDWRKVKSLFITHFIPNWEDPDWGHFGELSVADAVKQLSTIMSNRKLAKKALDLSRKMAGTASTGLINGWEEGDPICPPFKPFPFPPKSGTDTLPWKEIAAVEQIQIADIMTKLAGLTMSREYNQSLKSLANEIVRNVADKLIDDFERCGTVPRPKPKFKIAA